MTSDNMSHNDSARRGLRHWLALAALITLVLLAVKVGFQLLQQPDVARIYDKGVAAMENRNLGAVQAAAEAVAGLPGIPPYAAVLDGFVQLHYGRLREALAEFAVAVDAPETAALANALAGEALYRNQQFGDAITTLKAAVRIDPALTDAHRRLAAVYYDIGATGPAVHELETVAAQAPEDPRPFLFMGAIFKDMEDWERAISEYQRALQLDLTAKERDEALLALARCQVNAGRLEELEETLKQCPRNAETLVMAAQSRQGAGDDAGAATLVDEAVRLAPDDLEALLLQGNLRLSASNVDEAAQVLQRAAELHPLDFRVHHVLSRAYAMQGKTDLATQENQESARLRDMRIRFTELHAQAANDTGNAQLRYELGKQALELDLPELAMSWFTAALALDPQHAGARAALGMGGPPPAAPDPVPDRPPSPKKQASTAEPARG